MIIAVELVIIPDKLMIMSFVTDVFTIRFVLSHNNSATHLV